MAHPSSSTPAPFRIAIIGGGIGGLSTALFLQRFCPARSFDVTIYEQAPSYRDSSGAGIGLGVNATKLLHRVEGLGAACNAIAGSRDGVWFTLRRLDDSREITTVRSNDEGEVRQAMVARAELLRVLMGFVERNLDGAGRVCLGKKCRGVEVG